MSTFTSPASTPVLLLIFNRPLLTFQTLEKLRAMRPATLFIAGDGPRPNHVEDREAVRQARTVSEMVDWECDVKVLFRDRNLGCARAVSSAIDWCFENVDELIVLEDDCIPGADFIPFCAELLARFHHDDRILVISGDNFQKGTPRAPYSYYFSRFNHCWGWATWKRAWRHFDFDMEVWPEIRNGAWLTDILHDDVAVGYWTDIFDSVYAGKIDSWAYRWLFSCWVQGGLTVLPSVNLVQNVGFGEGATHTTRSSNNSIPVGRLRFPLVHPPYVIRDERADSWTQRQVFGCGRATIWTRVRDYCRSRLEHFR